MPGPVSKINDKDVITLNSIGISLQGIARRLGCHHTTVASRLRILGIAPVDTRRSFMEDIYEGLSTRQKEYLAEQVGNGSIKEYVESLIITDWLRRNQ